MIVIAIICHVIQILEGDKNTMKKSIIVLLIHFFSIIYVWTQNYNEPKIITKLDIDEYFRGYSESFETGKKEDSYILWNWPSKEGLKFTKNEIYIDEDGYSFFMFHRKKKTIIYGSNYLYSFGPSEWTSMEVYKPLDFLDFYKRNYLKKSIKSDGDFLWNFDILCISSSSQYQEKTKNGIIQYNSDYLNVLIKEFIDNSEFLLHNPWVPGKEKNPSGIGEYLEIEFAKPKDNIVVLNGFVDLEKRYLYKANNRVKKAVITSLDDNTPFEIEYDFEDYVHFSEINFPKAVNKVRFTIKEVYKGDKWDDTCIQAVITRWEE